MAFRGASFVEQAGYHRPLFEVMSEPDPARSLMPPQSTTNRSGHDSARERFLRVFEGPCREDRRFHVRFVRYLLAAATSLLFAALTCLGWAFGALTGPVCLVTCTTILLFIVVFYIAFRYGFNERACN